MIRNLFRRRMTKPEPSFRAFLVGRHGSVTDTLLDERRPGPSPRSDARPFAPTEKRPGELILHSRGVARAA